MCVDGTEAENDVLLLILPTCNYWVTTETDERRGACGTGAGHSMPCRRATKNLRSHDSNKRHQVQISKLPGDRRHPARDDKVSSGGRKGSIGVRRA